MSSRVIIQRLEASIVAYKLILEPIGTFIIRASTENDEIVSKIRFGPVTNSSPYVVLSVRVNEKEYLSPIMHYHLSLTDDEEDFSYILKQYEQMRTNENIGELPILREQCIVQDNNVDWEFDNDDFTKVDSSVHSSHMHMNGKYILQIDNRAISVFRKVFREREDDFGKEFSILKTLSYFHIVSFYGICTISNQTKYLVFANHGYSLDSQCPMTEYSGARLLKILSIIGFQIACGMMYLEAKHIIHRDLHAGNILIDKKYYVRIADFEHAMIKNIPEKKPMENFKRLYAAPECLLTLSKNGMVHQKDLSSNFSSKSDVWAVGMIFIELTKEKEKAFYSCLLLEKDDVKELMQLSQYLKIEKNIHEKPNHCPDDVYNILKQCWAYRPEDRISFANLRMEMKKLFDSAKHELEECSFI